MATSQVKISQLPILSSLPANTANLLLIGVNITNNDTTYQLTGTTLSQGLYANNNLVVGQNPILFSNTVAQFSSMDPSFVQVNLQNFNSNGSGDYIITADTGTNSNSYIDMGLGNSQASNNNLGFNAFLSYDGYLYVQGPTANGAQGNLILGTASSKANIIFIAGGTDNSNIVAWMTSNGLVLNTGSYITFSDGSTITSTVGSNTYLTAAFSQANAATNSAQAAYNDANAAYIQANAAFAQANATNTYADSAYSRANNSLSLTAGGTVSNNVTITGNLIANTVGTSVSLNNINSSNVVISNNLFISGVITSTGSLGNVFFSNITTVTSQANVIQWTPLSNNPVQVNGQIWYSTNTNSLILDTDIPNDRPSLSKVIFEKVYNGTGSTIPANSAVTLAGAVTSNGIAYITLSSATTYANSQILGLIKNAINANAYGYVYTVGILEGYNASAYNLGDILYVSPTAGLLQNTPPTGANTVVAVGKVLNNSSSNGEIQINIQQQPAAGKANGSVLYSNNQITVASNTLFINDSAQTLTMNATINMTGNITMAGGVVHVNNSTFSSGTNYGALMRLDASGGFAAQQPTSNGYILQLSGLDGIATRLSVDSAGANGTSGAYGLFVGRTARGTAAAPTAVQSGDLLARFAGNGYGTTGYSTVNGGVTIDISAIENYTDSTKGSQLTINPTIIGTNTRVTSVTINASNTTFGNTVILAGGSANNVPIKYVPGNISISAQVGAHEFDGNTYYFTPNDSERGVVPAEQIYIANTNYTLTANTSAQSLLGVAVSVTTNRRYMYQIRTVVQKVGNGGNTPTLAYGLGGTAVLGAHQYQIMSISATTQSTPLTTEAMMTNYITTAFSTPVVVTTSMPGGTAFANIVIEGWFDVVTGGTVSPQIAFSAAPNFSAYTQAGSFMRVWPISSALANTSVGTWAAG